MEHCTDKGSHEYYTTNNYNIRTCPFNEWQITVLHDLSKATSPEATAHNRRFVPIAEVMQVDVAVQAGLTRAEVIAVVLYTGPMVSRPVNLLLGPCAYRSRLELSGQSMRRASEETLTPFICPSVCMLQCCAASFPEGSQ
jgi:hypothetical protein